MQAGGQAVVVGSLCHPAPTSSLASAWDHPHSLPVQGEFT